MPMRIRDVIEEFVPCEVCGNRDLNKFYFHVLVFKGSQPYVKCLECEEEYYSTKAKQILTGLDDAIAKRTAGNYVDTQALNEGITGV